MRVDFQDERRIAGNICRKLSSRLPKNLPVISIEAGAYFGWNLRAIAYYVRKTLKENGVGFRELRIVEMGEDFCFKTCFKGHSLGSQSPKCRGCVIISLDPVKETPRGAARKETSHA